ncbi:MAG: undecaprenyl-diphosphate phosphatase [Anaerolineae bacterium]|nr:undecaprenyl-diphosphate phosphatase [Anaerolineae bacterium]
MPADIIKAIIMGIVEGITEYLPISSTGHLIVAGRLLDFQALGGTFEIFIQLGAVLAVIVFYARELWQQARTINQPVTQRIWLGIIIAFIPAGALGFILDRLGVLDAIFNPTVVAIALIVGGIIFLFVERRPQKQAAGETHALETVSLGQALIIGLGQCFSLIPGVSRSGATIVTGLLAGLDRPTATKFSFYLTIPTLGIATVYSLVRNLDQVTSNDLLLLAVGTIVSFIVSLFAIGWLLRYVARNNFIVFGYYRIVAGIIILILVAASVL